MTRRIWIAPLLCLSLIAAACASDEAGLAEDSETTVAEATTTVVTTTVAEAEEEPEVTDAEGRESEEDSVVTSDDSAGASAIDAARDVALEILDGRQLTEAEYEEFFDPIFVTQIDFAAFGVASMQLQSLGPWSVGQEGDRTDTYLDFELFTDDGEAWFMVLEVSGADDPAITQLFAGPIPEDAEVADFADGVSQLNEAGTVRLATFETTGGSCEVINEQGADEQMPLGSVFKLYVLGAVVTAVEAGELSWDDKVEVRDELDSIPSGITQNDEPGALLTVQEMATRMIEISDNTATDHLIDLVGREAVEQAVADYGHSQPERNRPFITTKEFTILKFGDDEGLVAQYIAADEAGKRAILEGLPTELPPVARVAAVTDPVEVESVEWFASPADVCRVLIDLASDPTAREVISQNPGIPDEGGVFDFIGFKGGSEPGVLATSWIVETADGRSFVMAGAVSNEDELIDETATIMLMAAVRDQLAEG